MALPAYTGIVCQVTMPLVLLHSSRCWRHPGTTSTLKMPYPGRLLIPFSVICVPQPESHAVFPQKLAVLASAEVSCKLYCCAALFCKLSINLM